VLDHFFFQERMRGRVWLVRRPSAAVNLVREQTDDNKWLELLLEIAPGLKRAAIMFNPDTAPVSVYMP
jgi:hypothetical protein